MNIKNVKSKDGSIVNPSVKQSDKSAELQSKLDPKKSQKVHYKTIKSQYNF